MEVVCVPGTSLVWLHLTKLECKRFFSGWVDMHAIMKFTCNECESFLWTILLRDLFVICVTVLVSLLQPFGI